MTVIGVQLDGVELKLHRQMTWMKMRCFLVVFTCTNRSAHSISTDCGKILLVVHGAFFTMSSACYRPWAI